MCKPLVVIGYFYLHAMHSAHQATAHDIPLVQAKFPLKWQKSSHFFNTLRLGTLRLRVIRYLRTAVSPSLGLVSVVKPIDLGTATFFRMFTNSNYYTR